MTAPTESAFVADESGEQDPASDALLHRLRAAFVEGIRDPEVPDLTLRQLAVLLTIAEGTVPPTVRHLAAYLHINKPAVVRAMDALEHVGFARRLPDQDDRRSVLLELTAKGRRHVARLAKAAAVAGER